MEKQVIRSELGFGKTDLVSVWEGTGQPKASSLDVPVEMWNQK